MGHNQPLSIEFVLHWQSPYGRHKDRHFVKKVDLALDIFPGRLLKQISSLEPGQIYEESFEAGVLVPPYEKNRIVKFKADQFSAKRSKHPVDPKPGRFYPQGFAWTALNCFPQSLIPFTQVSHP